MSVNIGRVAMQPKGAYAAATSYSKLDIVRHDGKVWIALQSSTGQTPAEGNYWSLLCDPIKGDSGNYPLVSDTVKTTETLEMAANTEYVYSGGLTALTLTFGAAATGYSSEYRIRFLAGAAAPTVTVPATVAWSPATPVFEAGKWYELSFVALGTGYVGVWTAAEVS